MSSIHNENAIRFAKDVLDAPNSVINLLSYGYVPHLRKNQSFEDLKCDLDNNKSARLESDFVLTKVREWHKKGILTKCDIPPLCVNPLTCASKYSSSTDEVKKRVCLDMSRTLNDHVYDCHTKLDTIETLRFLVPVNGYLTSTDFRH